MEWGAAGGVGLELSLNWIGATGLMEEADAIVTSRQMERTELGWGGSIEGRHRLLISGFGRDRMTPRMVRWTRIWRKKWRPCRGA